MTAFSTFESIHTVNKNTQHWNL